MRTVSVWVPAVAAAAVLGTACAERPVQQIEAARAALDAAVTAEAGEYAGEAHRAADEAVEALDAELATQEQTFALWRSYDRAIELAVAAETAAAAAEQAATAERSRVREETTMLVADARAALEEALLLLAEAPRGKGSEADLEALRTDLDGVSEDLVAAEDSLTQARYLEAREHAQAAKNVAASVRSSIEQARATTRRRG